MTSQEQILCRFLQQFGPEGAAVLDDLNCSDPLDCFDHELTTPAAYVPLATRMLSMDQTHLH
jgi:hypothetical protein